LSAKQSEHIERAVRLLCEPGLYELRCPKAGRYKTISGYFDDHAKLAAAALELSGSAPAVYVTLNPVNPDLLARAANSVRRYAEYTTQDNDVVRRYRLLIDPDFDRPAGISSSDAELKRALDKAREVRDYLSGLGWPVPLFANSGNGGHLVYKIDLPNDEETKNLLSSFLGALDARFSECRKGEYTGVVIDTSVFNASRISKLYGTLVMKGDHIPERPHRVAQIVEAPEQLEAVDVALIREVAGAGKPAAASKPATGPAASSAASSRPKIAWVDDFLERHQIEVLSRREGGGTWACRWEVPCPFCGEPDKAAAITLHAEGRYGYTCLHNRCNGAGGDKRKWRDFLAHYEPAGAGLPQIVTNGRQLRDVTRDALDALDAANDPPEYFVRGSIPVRLRKNLDEAPYFEVCGKDAMRVALAEVADWFTVRAARNKGEGEAAVPTKTPVSPPKDVVDAVLAQRHWPGLPPIRSISEVPVFVPGGRLVSAPGYDAGAKLWLEPSGLALPPIPEAPSPADVDRSRTLLEELLCDFPFADEASKANAVAMILLPYVRPLIAGPTPLHLINAPAPGTGKDLLGKLAVTLATGRECSSKSESHGEEEWKKNLTSWLTQAPTFVYFENVNYAVSSATFAKCLSGTAHRDRLLGRNDQEREVPVTCCWIMTGNNVNTSIELARRVVQIRIDANCEQPSRRHRFKHRLPEWAEQNRDALVAACLTLVRAWVAAGMPKGRLPSQIGSFERWAEVMGGILATAHVPGFLGNLDDVLTEVNTSEGEWLEFVAAWWDKYADQFVTTGDLYHSLCLFGNLLSGAFHQYKGAGAGPHQLGLALSKKKGLVLGGYKIEYLPNNHSHDRKTRWRLKPVRASSPTDEAEQNGAPTDEAEHATAEAEHNGAGGAGGCCGLLLPTHVAMQRECKKGGEEGDNPQHPPHPQQDADWQEERTLLAHLPHYWQHAVQAPAVAQSLGWPLDRVKAVLARMKERPGSWLRWTAFRDFGEEGCFYYRLTWQEANGEVFGPIPENPNALPDDLQAETEAQLKLRAEREAQIDLPADARAWGGPRTPWPTINECVALCQEGAQRKGD
jgi:hypothetical protein